MTFASCAVTMGAVDRSTPCSPPALWLGACTGAGGDVADPAVSESTSGSTPVPATPTTLDRQTDAGAVPGSGSLVTIVAVAETGVPGLDSDDAFCAAWSRFGGSWQVLLVGSTFLGDPERVATWEIASAAIIVEAYAELIRHFPVELATEAEPVADAYFGVLYRRATVAGASLVDAGSSAETVRRLGQAWLEALAERDPLDPNLAFEVPDDLREVVGRAAADFRSRRVGFHLDPSMVVEADTPLTDTYLETACPDQGTLTGQEVDDG